MLMGTVFSPPVIVPCFYKYFECYVHILPVFTTYSNWTPEVLCISRNNDYQEIFSSYSEYI